MADLKEWTDSSNSLVRVDVRRFLNSELQAMISQATEDNVPLSKFQDLQEKVTEMNDVISFLNKDINNLREKINQEVGKLNERYGLYEQSIQSTERSLPQSDEDIKTERSIDNYSDVKSETETKSFNETKSMNETPLQPEKKVQIDNRLTSPLSDRTPVRERSIQSNPESTTKPLSLLNTSTAPRIITTPTVSDRPSQKHVVRIPIIQDDSAANQKQLQRLNEAVNSIKFSIDELNSKVSLNENNLNQLDQVSTELGKLSDEFKNNGSSPSKNEIRSQIYKDTSNETKAPIQSQSQSQSTPSPAQVPDNSLDHVIQELKSKVTKLEKDMTDIAKNIEHSSKAKKEPLLHAALRSYPSNIFIAPPSGGENQAAPPEIELESDSVPSSNKSSSKPSPMQSQKFEEPKSTPKEDIEDTGIELTPNQNVIVEQQKPKFQEKVIRILRKPSKQAIISSPLPQEVPQISQKEIEEKVDAAIKASISGFLDRAKAESQKEVANGLKVLNPVIAKIDTKIDRDYVDRMYNKFRVIIKELKDKIDQMQTTFLGWVTREEMMEVLQNFVSELHEVKDTAVGQSKYRCLLCGKPRSHIAGMIITNPSISEEEDFHENVSEQISRPRTSIKSPKLSKPIQNDAKRIKTPAPARNVIQLLTTTPTS